MIHCSTERWTAFAMKIAKFKPSCFLLHDYICMYLLTNMNFKKVGEPGCINGTLIC